MSDASRLSECKTPEDYDALLLELQDAATECARRGTTRWEIVVVAGGFVFAGRTRREGMDLVLTDAAVVRRWGTDRGLGQLAEEGPRQNTTMDLTPLPIIVPESAVLHRLGCVAKPWDKWSASVRRK